MGPMNLCLFDVWLMHPAHLIQIHTLHLGYLKFSTMLTIYGQHYIFSQQSILQKRSQTKWHNSTNLFYPENVLTLNFQNSDSLSLDQDPISIQYAHLNRYTNLLPLPILNNIYTVFRFIEIFPQEQAK